MKLSYDGACTHLSPSSHTRSEGYTCHDFVEREWSYTIVFCFEIGGFSVKNNFNPWRTLFDSDSILINRFGCVFDLFISTFRALLRGGLDSLICSQGFLFLRCGFFDTVWHSFHSWHANMLSLIHMFFRQSAKISDDRFGLRFRFPRRVRIRHIEWSWVYFDILSKIHMKLLISYSSAEYLPIKHVRSLSFEISWCCIIALILILNCFVYRKLSNRIKKKTTSYFFHFFCLSLYILTQTHCLLIQFLIISVPIVL